MMTIEPRNLPESKQRQQINPNLINNEIENEELKEEDFTLRTLEASTDILTVNNNKVEGSNPSVNDFDVSTLERLGQKRFVIPVIKFL